MSALQPIEVPERPVSEVLYKYLPPERIDILENMQLRFSRPSEFNDTFDTQYLVPRAQGSKGIADRFKLRNQLGILCLTERSDNHLMWVHYARNHTGFILGFNAKASFFRENDRKLKKVIYQNRPQVLLDADIKACFCKSDEWEHEQEWRCVRRFQSSETRMADIKPSLITQIIFGSEMEKWQIARIMLYATALEMTQTTQFLLSAPSKSSWTFENRPKTMSLCDKCDGDGYLMEDSKITGQ